MNEANASPEYLVEATGLCKFYGTREVLHEVNLTIRANEIVTLVGPNGAGKTTLLKILLGLESPQHGSVALAPGLRIGYVPQSFTPQPSMPLTARAFLELYAPHAQERIATLCGNLDISEILDSQLHTLSGGEQRRLLLVRALLHQPQLLVLDEPTQGVDIAGQGELYRLLKRLSAEMNFAVLMVSHDLHVVMAATQRVICLNHHICCEGAPSQVGNDPAFKTLFGDELARQVALYHHHHDHKHDVHGDHFHHHDESCNHG